MDGFIMPYVRVKQKYQVTLPVALRDKLDLKAADDFIRKERNAWG